MAYVEDVAASGAASWSDAFSSLTQINFGSKNINFSGNLDATNAIKQAQDAATTSEARAVASTAKAGDGGVASSSASLSEMAGAMGLDLKTVAIGLLAAAVAGLGLFAIFKRPRKKKGKK